MYIRGTECNQIQTEEILLYSPKTIIMDSCESRDN